MADKAREERAIKLRQRGCESQSAVSYLAETRRPSMQSRTFDLSHVVQGRHAIYRCDKCVIVSASGCPP